MICWKSFYADLVLNFFVIIIGAQFFLLSILKNNLEMYIFFPGLFDEQKEEHLFDKNILQHYKCLLLSSRLTKYSLFLIVLKLHCKK